jgi:hypothetical protein
MMRGTSVGLIFQGFDDGTGHLELTKGGTVHPDGLSLERDNLGFYLGKQTSPAIDPKLGLGMKVGRYA